MQAQLMCSTVLVIRNVEYHSSALYKWSLSITQFEIREYSEGDEATELHPSFYLKDYKNAVPSNAGNGECRLDNKFCCYKLYL